MGDIVASSGPMLAIKRVTSHEYTTIFYWRTGHMSTFEDRETAFEAKFAMDEQKDFIARMRRNRFMAVWAS
ncbi:MAG: ATPase inhibitor subunit zeta, partial [Shimia sp.]|uniref:ATPase inhibitor subunit zeta n=1 Tax=Shimia sp. TaxID=1954381 RepID=UPI004059D721